MRVAARAAIFVATCHAALAALPDRGVAASARASRPVRAATLARRPVRTPTREAAPRFHAELTVLPNPPRNGEPCELSVTVRDSLGASVRFLQFVHERPLHLLVVSRDLADFAHIHPEPGFADVYAVTHTFEHGGGYRLFVDYTPPGSGTLVDPFDLAVAGEAPAPRPLVVDSLLDRTVDGVRVTLAFDRPPRAGQDVLLIAALSDASTGAPITDLQLYLGALAHFILISADLTDFIHAHPLETGEVFDPSAGPDSMHVHDPARLAKVLVGPSPATIRAATSFPRAGLYKLWIQFQRGGRVATVPFVLDVGSGRAAPRRAGAAIPRRAIAISVGSSGYAPARVDLRLGEPAVLAFTRPRAGNCGGTLVIPELGVRRELPVGETVLVRFTPREPAEIPFTCGMGMYQGLIVVR